MNEAAVWHLVDEKGAVGEARDEDLGRLVVVCSGEVRPPVSLRQDVLLNE